MAKKSERNELHAAIVCSFKLMHWLSAGKIHTLLTLYDAYILSLIFWLVIPANQHINNHRSLALLHSLLDDSKEHLSFHRISSCTCKAVIKCDWINMLMAQVKHMVQHAHAHMQWHSSTWLIKYKCLIMIDRVLAQCNSQLGHLDDKRSYFDF